MELSADLLKKAEACKTIEEIAALAKENDIEISEADAKWFLEGEFAEGELEELLAAGVLADGECKGEFAEGELADEELDNVAGGRKGCSGRNAYHKIWWDRRDQVQYVCNVGDRIEVYVGPHIGNDTATCKVTDRYIVSSLNNTSFADGYSVSKISGCGIMFEITRDRIEKRS